jgi:Fic-DOC domain mobile mystery protein B
MLEPESIDGETPIDTSEIRIKGIRTRRDLNRVEAENIFKATTKYLASKPTKQLAPFDLAWCQRLHGEMFCDVWDWAGQIRTRNLNIGVTFGAIRENLALLLSDLHSWSGYGMEIVEQAARLHFRAVHIHPFMNGNGRWSRMLANIWLSRNDHEIVNWPEATFGTESVARKEYIAAIRKAVEHEFGPLLELHRRYAKP